MQDVSKQRRSVFSTHLQGLQHLKLLDPPAQPRANAETVKAFMHPTLARLCTAHDCILLSRATAMAERSRVPVSRLFNNARGFEPHLGRKFKKEVKGPREGLSYLAHGFKSHF